MLAQEHMIESVRTLCHADRDVVGALMYGSFAKGEGDRHSDIEFWLFFDKTAPTHGATSRGDLLEHLPQSLAS